MYNSYLLSLVWWSMWCFSWFVKHLCHFWLGFIQYNLPLPNKLVVSPTYYNAPTCTVRGTRRWSRLLTQNTGVDNHSIQAPDNFDQASISTKCTYSKLFKLVYDVMVENLCWEKLLSFKTAFNEKREEETLNHLDEILLIMLHALEKCKHHYTCNTPWLANYPSIASFEFCLHWNSFIEVF